MKMTMIGVKSQPRKAFFYLCIYAPAVFLLTLAYPYLFDTNVKAQASCNLTLGVVGSGIVTEEVIDPDLRVEIGPDNGYIIFENSQIKVQYAPFFDGHDQFAIKDFYVKSVGQNQVGSYLDADAGRGPLANASIIYNGADRKTVHLEWNDKYNDPEKKIIHEVSIFPDSSFIKIDYINVLYGINIVDLGQPGGTLNGTHVAYGGNSWIRDYVTREYSPTVGSYYNRYPDDGVNDPVDGGSLNYHDHFILGVYNPVNNRGLARVMPVADSHIVKLLLADDQRQGFELFPYPFLEPHDPFTGYLYSVTRGEAEVLSLGQQLADGDYGRPQCGDDVKLTSIPDPGWTFEGWSGDLSGVANPITLTLTSNHAVTSTFIHAADTTPPTVDVWYGSHQVFGQVGTPQRWINILGNVSDAGTGMASLVYSLNGVPGSSPLSIGPDLRRLVGAGDFNIELDKASLVDGLNTVVITATDGASNQTVETVTVEYDNSQTWPLPYSIDWSSVTNAQDAVQIVDGLWTWDANGIRTNQVGYDRVIAIGDMAWDDYEVLVPVTIHAIDESAYGSPISIGPGLGVNLRWQGHTDSPIVCSQPHCGWEPTGGSNWYEWRQTLPGRLQLTATPPSGTVSTTDRQFEMGHTYWFRARVETNPTGSLYSLKVWEDGVETEPEAWTLQKQAETGNLANGSFLLVAHHVDATFGNVTVHTIDITYTLTITTVGNGTVTVDPYQSSYLYGQEVTLTAEADPGSSFSGWSGSLSGSTNPATLTLTSDKAVTATFIQDAYDLTVHTVGDGTVTRDPDQLSYPYGQVVTLTATADSGSSFSGWSGALSGNTNPVTLALTSDKVVTATFAVNGSYQFRVFLPIVNKNGSVSLLQ